jgi:uncharacterized protein with von Willebrand factor type A (vWA) domain
MDVGRLLCLDVGRPDPLAPFLDFVSNQLAKIAGELDSGVRPRSARRALSAGSARLALISLLSLSMISAGAPMPNHCVAS